MGFFPEGAVAKPDSGGWWTQLDRIVEQFPPKLKQAMYAATQQGKLKKGTWDGCAFNAAGSVEGEKVTSYNAAVRVFDVDASIVHKFISFWDSCTVGDQYRTQKLAEALIHAGLTEPVRTKMGGLTRVVRGYAFKGTATQFKEQLESVNTLSDLPGFTEADEQAVAQLVGV